jgi:ribonuclease HII
MPNEKKVKPKSQSTFELEKKLLEEGYDFVIGIDEVGRGPLAGPVVACAVSHKHNSELISGNLSEEYLSIKDSKLLSEKKREELYAFICENFHFGLGICDHLTIDRINILEATYLAMKKAIASLNSQFDVPRDKRKIILVDGNKKIPNLSVDQWAIVNGDRIVKSISAASIIAKVTRDRMMHEADKRYPAYGFAKHKGYGTKIHMEQLRRNGLCEIHRKSFCHMCENRVGYRYK